MKPNQFLTAKDLFAPTGGLLQTPAGIHVPPDAFQELVKAQARNIAKQEGNNVASLFSKYMLASNMAAYGAREKPPGTPTFDLLYQAAKKSWIDGILIRARTDQMKMVWSRALSTKDVGFKVVHDRYKDSDYEVTESDENRCREMEELLNNPTPVEYIHLYPNGVRPHNSLKDFISRMVRAELIIDRKVMRRFKRRNGKGYAAFHWVPGGTIRPVHEGLKAYAKKYQGGKVTSTTLEMASNKCGFDLANSVYCQLVDGEIIAAFTEEELSLHIANPSDEMDRFGYGESRLEISLDLTSTMMMAWTYNRELFNTNYPDSILSVTGDYDKEGLEAFKQQILKEAGGVGKNHRLPVIPGEDGFKVEAHKLRDTPKDMLYDNMIRMMVALKCAAYGAHPTIINFSVDSPGSGGLFGHNPSDEIEFSKEHGLKPALSDLCDWLTEAIVKPTYPDLRLILVGIEEEDEKTALELLTMRGDKFLTRNEMRLEDGKEAVGDLEDPDNPYNYPSDAPLSTYIEALASRQQQGTDEEYQEPGAEADLEGTEDLPPEEAPEEYQEPEPEGEALTKSNGETFLKIWID